MPSSHEERKSYAPPAKTILTTQTGFLYNGANAVQELSGATVTANSLSGGIDEVFQRTDSAGARTFLADALGSTLGLTDSTGTVQTQYTSDPFGNTTASGASSTNSFAYTGRELDATGLYYYRARYYHPAFQRFASEDPIGFGGETNTYAYVSNSPTNFFDPLGLNKKDPFDRARDLARCAAEVSQAGSLNKLTHGVVPELVGSNSFGDLTGALLGPGNWTDPSRVDQGLHVGLDYAVHVGAHVALEAKTDWDLVNIADTGLLTFTPETLGSLTVVGETTVGGLASALLWGKIGLDAAVFAESLVVCAVR